MSSLIETPPQTRLITERSDIVESAERYGIDWRSWGTVKEYTIDHLVELLAKAEAELTDTGGGLRLKVQSVVVILRHFTGSSAFELIESHQILLPSYAWRARGFPDGFAETLDKNESLEHGAHRAIREEPGHSEPLLHDPSMYHLDKMARADLSRLESHDKWDGLEGVYERNIIEGSLNNAKAFNPYGYFEVQEGKKVTFLKWINVEPQAPRDPRTPWKSKPASLSEQAVFLFAAG